MDGTIGAALRRARRRLQAAPYDTSTREASLLLGHLTGYSEARLLAHGEEPLPPEAQAAFEGLLRRRLRGEPVAYLTGRREFYGREFLVDDRVLIPRPETEHLVEAVLETVAAASRKAARNGPAAPLALVDVGTGSGCLAVTLALELPSARVLASDLSLGALAVARANARLHGVEDRVRFVAGDLLGAFSVRELDLVISNPPYVAEEDAGLLPRDVRDFEPHLALFAAEDGLAVLRRLLEEARRLAPGARVLAEIGFGQLEGLKALARQAGWRVTREIADYGGIPRTVALVRDEVATGKEERWTDSAS